MRFRPKPIVSFLASAVLSTLQLQAAGAPCPGQPNSEAINLAVAGAIESVRSGIFNPNLESQRADLSDAIALLEQQRAELQTILAAWNPTAAADFLAQVAKTIADLGIELCRLGCPAGGADVVIQMRDQVYSNLTPGNEAVPAKLMNVEKLALNYPSKHVKKSAQSTQAFANHLSASLQPVQAGSNDQAPKASLVKLDDQLSQLQSRLLTLNAKLAQLEAENKGFPAVLVKLTENSITTGQVQFSCSESHTTGGDGGSSSSTSHNSDSSGSNSADSTGSAQASGSNGNTKTGTSAVAGPGASTSGSQSSATASF